KEGEKPLWLSVGYHHMWNQAITKAVNNLTRDPRHKIIRAEAFGKEPPPLRISWKKILPTSASMIEKVERKVAKDMNKNEDS
ncbi:MAG: hypothetical protein ACKPKO_53205, partial [Candidatus Fonsibacter sp.]